MTDGSWPLVDPPTRRQVARRAEDLRRRVVLVRRYGWDQYGNRWSTGEVLGAALVLNEQAELRRWSETTESALSGWPHPVGHHLRSVRRRRWVALYTRPTRCTPRPAAPPRMPR